MIALFVYKSVDYSVYLIVIWQIFIECLLCARYSSSPLRHISDKTVKYVCPHGSYTVAGAPISIAG